MNQHRELCIRALGRMRGDDLRRAQQCFQGCTPEEMAAPYGDSGQTRAQYLAKCEDQENRIDAAMRWLGTL